MRRGGLFFLLALTLWAQFAHAKPVAVTQWRSGFIELNRGWAGHDGDNLAWAETGYDDSGWRTVDLEDMGAAEPGWRWFRLHVNLGSDHTTTQFLLDGGEGTYELYVNGERIPGPQILSPFAVSRPTERVFELRNDQGDFEIAVRTRATPSYAVYQLPLFIGVTMGNSRAIEYERQSLESDRLYSAIPSIAINLLLVLAGLGALGLFASQRMQRDYLFLSLFLLTIGISGGLWHLEQAGILPLSGTFLIADPLFYFVCITQIEFTFSFARRRVGNIWRIYEAVLLLPLLLVVPSWLGHFSGNTYNLVQAIVTAPLVFLLPAILFAWYRGGNREAGWLIFPSLLPAAGIALYDLGIVSILLNWNRLNFLIEPFPFGPIPVQPSDAGNLFFLLAIGIVMFFRFTRVSREQARSAAELDAAREVQRRLVPASLPLIAGYRVEAAYWPAQEVGGDFYQVLKQADSSALVVVGDVSGKGLKAAMTGALAIGALRTLSAEGLEPAALLARLNEQMLSARDGGFITCLCARVRQDGAVVIANAGHLSPYKSGQEIELGSGLPLGIADGAEYSEMKIQLNPGETLTLLSDGVVEARNSAGELFGFERTRAISGQSAEKIAEAAQKFGQDDDITVLTLSLESAIVAK